MQFRPACTAVSVADVTIFTTFLLQPTKCNFLRYVCEHDDGGRKRRRGAQGGGSRERKRKRENMRVESIVVGMKVPRWEGCNERLAISSINIFRRFVNGRPVSAGPPPVVDCARFATLCSVPSPRFKNHAKRHYTTKCLTRCRLLFFFLPRAGSHPEA